MYDWSEFDSELEKHEYMKQLGQKKACQNVVTILLAVLTN